MNQKTNKLKATILSLSLVTVMAGAAVAPALGTIGDYFQDTSPTLIKFIITIPALLIIITSLLFGIIAKHFSAKSIATFGLILYILGGCFAGFVNNIYLLLAFRVIFGIGVGLVMPLSTGLIAYFFPKNEQTKLMGYSSAMNNLGGIIATTLSGFLVSISWRYSFLIYLMGLVVILLVLLYLPKSSISNSTSSLDAKSLRKLLPYVLTMFAVMAVFYALPSNFSMVMAKENLVPTSIVGLIMSLQNIFAFITGMIFSFLLKKLKHFTKFFGIITLALGFFFLGFTNLLISTILGVIFVGFGLGTLLPILNAQIPFLIRKENLTAAMALASAMIYLGEFLSPIIIDSIQKLLHLEGIQIPYNIAAVFAVILFFVFIKLPIMTNDDLK